VGSLAHERVLEAIEMAETCRRRVRALKAELKSAKIELSQAVIDVWSAQWDEFYNTKTLKYYVGSTTVEKI
jgi:hypothetical protein